MMPMVKNVAAGVLVLVVAFLVIEGIKKARAKKQSPGAESVVNPAQNPTFVAESDRDVVG